ncbi:lamin-L(III)-like [Pelobates fuscus]|uniref:lamin-L(III)-like n=1 Tax=Pelobates fuscus TaxID=191477 RepID=UPI002FE4A90E
MATGTPGRSTSQGPAAGAQSPGSPTRLSRLQEKEQLRHLNDRLAAYIERVRSLESDKAGLKRQLEEQEEEFAREVSSLKLLYETELADARKLLDQTANERARLQVDLGQVREDHRLLHNRNVKKENDLNLALNQLRDFESKLNSKEAELATVLCQNRSIEGELKDVKSQITIAEASLRDTTKQLHKEMLWRVDLENKMQTLREQMDFEKSIHEQEVREMRKRHESKLVEIDSGCRTEFESKLATALQELRRDHERQITEYKEQLEKTFSAKLENAQLAAVKNNDYASATREEIMSTKQRIDSLTSQLSQYQKQNSALEAKQRDLEDMLENACESHRREMNEKDHEVAEMRQRLQIQLDEYEQLLDVKLALDMEINAYRKMLEGEEQRLKLSPSPSQRTSVSRLSRGKKRKLATERAESRREFEVVQKGSSVGPVTINDIDPDGKYVRLVNSSEEDQQMHGWTVRRQHGSLTDIVYKFPGRFVLEAGQSVTIWAACAGAVHRPPSDLVWKSQICWGTGDDVKLTLLDSTGEECAESTLKLIFSDESEMGEEIYEEEFTSSHFHAQPHQPVDPSCCVM